MDHIVDDEKPFIDLNASPDAVHRLVRAILDGDAATAIDVLCEDYPELVSYQHQRAMRSAITGRVSA